ncbi:MAG: winged helix-turn-helix transcriptional regulator [Candidatus Thorarchaeota archaeon]|nr:winged helix-turn-helix transcriptional regulator [Candidatus Thorarchaeota archaeon]MCK5238053.1 winged helix-turn-helix transcriptional regulator [Candidatus Thorarchaeota archaeon]
MNTEPPPRISIEDLFSSRGRIKVLRELAESNELNISEICRRVSLNHSTTKSHLRALVASGLIEEKSFGRIKIYRYRIEDLRARSLKNFLELWHS